MHAKNCVNGQQLLAAANKNKSYGSYGSRGGGGSGGNSNRKHQPGHVRNNSRDQVHSWHSPYTASSPLAQSSTLPGNQSQHNNNNYSSHSQNNVRQEPCGQACNLPTRAYCVRRKICDTIYGSVRLCVVLKRVSRIDGQMYNNNSGHYEGYKSVGEAVWETTDQMVAIKVREVCLCLRD